MTARGVATRGRLIEATLAVVREQGYAHTTVRAIATAAGVAEGTLYRHFPDKAALFFAAVVERHAPVMAWVGELPARAGQNTVQENLTECLRRLSVLQADVVPLELAILADPELARQRARAVPAPGGPLPGPAGDVAAYLAAEQQLGRVRSDVDPTHLAVVVLATLLGLVLAPGPLAPLEGDDGDPALIDIAVRLLLDGMAG